MKVTGPCPPNVYSGMFGRIFIPLEDEDVLVVPPEAVRRVGQLDEVDVVEGDTRQPPGGAAWPDARGGPRGPLGSEAKARRSSSREAARALGGRPVMSTAVRTRAAKQSDAAVTTRASRSGTTSSTASSMFSWTTTSRSS